MKMYVKAIIPKELLGDPKKIERAINNALDTTALAIKVDFDVTTRTWRRRPLFYIRRDEVGKRTIYTENKIYMFVSGGTKIRYATMTPGFRAKTIVRQIYSGPGRGGFAYLSKKKPRPGIKARQFPDVIVKKWSGKRLGDAFQRSIDSEAGL